MIREREGGGEVRERKIERERENREGEIEVGIKRRRG